MGYTTEFQGFFKLDKPLDKETKKILDGLNRTRRMKRDLTKLGMTMEEAANYGIDGEFYFPPKTNLYGQDMDDSIVNYNAPPMTQPGLWCKWRYDKKNNSIEWDGMEKFYNYVQWLKYIIGCVLEPAYKLNGKVIFSGEDGNDNGIIIIKNNKITIK